MPLRFFCNKCRQLLKIGHSQAGTLIVCPKCRSSVGVPFNSHPQAEQLYQFIKQKKTDAEAAVAEKSKPSLLHRSRYTPAGGKSYYENLDLYLKDALRSKDEKKPDKTVPPPSNLEESVEQWMDEFWESNVWVPEEHAAPPPRLPQTALPSGTSRSTITKTADSVPAKPAALSVIEQLDEEDAAAMVVRQRIQIKNLKILAAITLLIGMLLGFCTHLVMVRTAHSNIPAAHLAEAQQACEGTISYKNTSGESQPDTDAVVILIPVDAKPLVPIDCRSLRPGESVNDESVRQIEELGGKYFRCDANGSFVFEFKPNERYMALFISAHSKRTDNLSPDITIKLRKYFLNPTELFGDYRFSMSEHSWKEGRYIMPLTL